jgi:hypothetical protein
MKKLTVLALTSLLVAAFSANAAETGKRKHTLSGSNVKKVRVIQPQVEKPVTRLPIPPDTFRA